MPNLQTLPRAAVHGYLRLLRLPLDVASRVAHRDDSSPWAASVTYEAFEAKVKDVAGTLLRDEELRRESVVQGARVDQLRKSAENLAAAEAKKAVADRRLNERQEAAEEKKERAENRVQAEKTKIKQSKAQAKETTRRRTTRQKRSAARGEQSRKETVAEKATAAKAKTLDAEHDALLERSRAAEAKAGAREIADAAAATASAQGKRQLTTNDPSLKSDRSGPGARVFHNHPS